jgi:hypothetical protein
MADLLKNVVSLITLVLFFVGTGFTIYGIFKTNDMSEKNLEEKFIIPSQVLNGLTVMFLLYLTATNLTFSPSYKLLIIFLLVGGIIIEIYLTSYANREAESIAAYVFISLNFLIRAFFLIDLVQSEWVKPFTSPVKPIQEALKESVMRPAEQAIKDIIAPKPSPQPKTEAVKDASRDLDEKWKKLKDFLKTRPEGYDASSESDAWKTVIKPAKESDRKDVMAVLKEAVAVMKDSNGNPIPLNSVDSIGGSRK